MTSGPIKGNFIGIVGNRKSAKFAGELFNKFQNNPGLPVVKLNVPFNGRILPSVRLSDHASFWDQGFRAVMVTDSAFFRNPHYHLPSDTMEKLNYRFMAELVESLLLFFRSHQKWAVILSDGTCTEIRQSILIEKVLVTDSDPFQSRLACGFYAVFSLFSASRRKVTHLMLWVKSK